jgi:predicted nucleic acid-binding protein
VRFADTNVLLYAISKDPAERSKADLANTLLEQRDIALSAQVLQEFYVQATRVTRPDALRHEDAAELVRSFQRFPVAAITSEIVIAAMATRERYKVSYWDAAIIEAARSMGCEVVLSEDLSDSVDYAGVRVENPFRS